MPRDTMGIDNPSSVALGLTQMPMTAMPTAMPGRKMPGPGYIPGTLQLNPKIAPSVPSGAARPFAPGESVKNPDGSWSSEISVTVVHPELNGGKPTILPSLWVKDGKPYVAANEDEAVALAKASGLEFPSFNSVDQAEAFSNQREQAWQRVGPEGAQQVPPLWVMPMAQAGTGA